MNRNAFAAALVCPFVVTGCALMPSPAVGEWTGTMTANPQGGAIAQMGAGMLGAMGSATADLTLKADGTGYARAMGAPERPITWKMDGDRVLIFGANAGKNANPSDAMVARLSEDKRTLLLDMGPIQVNLQKKTK